MDDSPSTRPSLLIRLRDPDDDRAWAECVEIYTPLIHRLARQRGLQEADAADLAQEVFRILARSIHRFDVSPEKGHFRGWLFRVARNLMIDCLAREGGRVRGSGDADIERRLEEQPDPSLEDSLWFDLEYRRRLFDWAAAKVRAEVSATEWQAFALTAIDGRPALEVAARLVTSVGAIYSYKSRVMGRLRRLVEGVESPR